MKVAVCNYTKTLFLSCEIERQWIKPHFSQNGTCTEKKTTHQWLGIGSLEMWEPEITFPRSGSLSKTQKEKKKVCGFRFGFSSMASLVIYVSCGIEIGYIVDDNHLWSVSRTISILYYSALHTLNIEKHCGFNDFPFSSLVCTAELKGRLKLKYDCIFFSWRKTSCFISWISHGHLHIIQKPSNHPTKMWKEIRDW